MFNDLKIGDGVLYIHSDSSISYTLEIIKDITPKKIVLSRGRTFDIKTGHIKNVKSDVRNYSNGWKEGKILLNTKENRDIYKARKLLDDKRKVLREKFTAYDFINTLSLEKINKILEVLKQWLVKKKQKL